MKKTKKTFWVILPIIVMIGGLGFGLRSYAQHTMLVDFDEPTYINIALDYANFIRDGDYKWIAWYDQNAEHPILGKLAYAAMLLTQPQVEDLGEKDIMWLKPVYPDGARYVYSTRLVAVIFGSLTVVVLAILNPLAGLLLAIQNTAIHYTSTIYLEALPALMSTCAAFCYVKWLRTKPKKLETPSYHPTDLWFYTSGMFLGLTAGSKYVYALVGIAIGIDYLWRSLKDRKNWKYSLFKIIGWGFITIGFFFIFNPILWPHPIQRLVDSIIFHKNYAQSEFVVVRTNHPWWQPFVWLVSQNPRYHPAFFFNPDLVILILSFIGLPFTWKKNRVFAIWLILSLVFLLVWRTKWPQYIMILVTPLCLSAAVGLQNIFYRLSVYLNRKSKKTAV
ncbi:MAG: hypothetical protein CL609_17585 [Anaerolineaceae bacterium]|nr:hypothetical protein [Anaerolineaceae bacterium]